MATRGLKSPREGKMICVSIRTAGAGIVAGSTPEKEFAETELKFRAMLEALRA